MESCAIEEVGTQIDAPGDEVVGIGTTLRIVFNRLGDRKIIIVDHEGAMVRLDQQIGGGVVMQRLLEIRAPWVIQSAIYRRRSGRCGSTDRGIDGRVEFDAAISAPRTVAEHECHEWCCRRRC